MLKIGPESLLWMPIPDFLDTLYWVRGMLTQFFETLKNGT